MSKKSVCNPVQRRRVWGSGDKALLPGGRRFFDFAQNDIFFLLRRPFLDTLSEKGLLERVPAGPAASPAIRQPEVDGIGGSADLQVLSQCLNCRSEPAPDRLGRLALSGLQPPRLSRPLHNSLSSPRWVCSGAERVLAGPFPGRL